MMIAILTLTLAAIPAIFAKDDLAVLSAENDIANLAGPKPTSRPIPTWNPPSTEKKTGCAGDFFFVLDASGSVQEYFENQMNFVKGVVDRLTIDPQGHRVGVLQYSSAWYHKVAFGFDKYDTKEGVMEGLNKLKFVGGTTNTGVALRIAIDEIKRTRRPDHLTFVIVVTDGFSQDPLIPMARKLRSMDNMRTYAVAVTDPLNVPALLEIVGGDDYFIHAGVDYQKWLDAYLGEKFLLCEIREPETTTTSTTTTTTTTTPFLQLTTCSVDVIMVIDASGSHRSQFERCKTIAKKIIDSLAISEDRARVAMIKFASRFFTQRVFDFDQYVDKPTLKAAIDGLRWIGGTTAVSKGLEMAIKEAKKARGKPLVILLSDGYFHDYAEPEAKELREMASVYAMGVSLEFKQEGEPFIMAPSRNNLAKVTGSLNRVFIDTQMKQFVDTLSNNVLDNGCITDEERAEYSRTMSRHRARRLR